MLRAKVCTEADMIDYQEIDERISKCEKILSSNPGSQIFAALAEAHRRRGDLDTAFQVCQRGLKSHPTYGSAHVVMAKINLDKGLYDWADTEIEKASRQGGNVHAIELLRCEVLIAKGEFEQAERQIRRQLKNSPSNSQLQKLLESLKSAEPRPAEVKFPGGAPSELTISPQRKKSRPLGARLPDSQATQVKVSAQSEPSKVARITANALSSADVLERGLALEGVFGAFRQELEGETLDSRWESEGCEDEYSSSAYEAFRSVNSALERIAFGACRTVLVESGGVKMYFLVSKDELFVFYAGAATNTNRLRASLNQIWKAFEANPQRDS